MNRNLLISVGGLAGLFGSAIGGIYTVLQSSSSSFIGPKAQRYVELRENLTNYVANESLNLSDDRTSESGELLRQNIGEHNDLTSDAELAREVRGYESSLRPRDMKSDPDLLLFGSIYVLSIGLVSYSTRCELEKRVRKGLVEVLD